MTDMFTQYERIAISALQSPEPTDLTDHLAQKLLEAAAQGRQQRAVAQVTAGEVSKITGQFQAETSRAEQFDTNVKVQQAMTARSERNTRQALNQAMKARSGKNKALENLRPAYHALKDISLQANDVAVSDREFRRRVQFLSQTAL